MLCYFDGILGIPWSLVQVNQEELIWLFNRQAAAFIVGYIQQDIHLMLWIGLAGTAFTALVVVPPWPFYNRNPEAWLNSKTKVPGGVSGITVDGVKVG